MLISMEYVFGEHEKYWAPDKVAQYMIEMII